MFRVAASVAGALSNAADAARSIQQATNDTLRLFNRATAAAPAQKPKAPKSHQLTNDLATFDCAKFLEALEANEAPAPTTESREAGATPTPPKITTYSQLIFAMLPYQENVAAFKKKHPRLDTNIVDTLHEFICSEQPPSQLFHPNPDEPGYAKPARDIRLLLLYAEPNGAGRFNFYMSHNEHGDNITKFFERLSAKHKQFFIPQLFHIEQYKQQYLESLKASIVEFSLLKDYTNYTNFIKILQELHGSAITAFLQLFTKQQLFAVYTQHKKPFSILQHIFARDNINITDIATLFLLVAAADDAHYNNDQKQEIEHLLTTSLTNIKDHLSEADIGTLLTTVFNTTNTDNSKPNLMAATTCVINALRLDPQQYGHRANDGQSAADSANPQVRTWYNDYLQNKIALLESVQLKDLFISSNNPTDANHIAAQQEIEIFKQTLKNISANSATVAQNTLLFKLLNILLAEPITVTSDTKIIIATFLKNLENDYIQQIFNHKLDNYIKLQQQFSRAANKNLSTINNVGKVAWYSKISNFVINCYYTCKCLWLNFRINRIHTRLDNWLENYRQQHTRVIAPYVQEVSNTWWLKLIPNISCCKIINLYHRYCSAQPTTGAPPTTAAYQASAANAPQLPRQQNYTAKKLRHQPHHRAFGRRHF